MSRPDTIALSDGSGWAAFRVTAVLADGSADPHGCGTLATYPLFGCQDPCSLDLRLTVHGTDQTMKKQRDETIELPPPQAPTVSACTPEAAAC